MYFPSGHAERSSVSKTLGLLIITFAAERSSQFDDLRLDTLLEALGDVMRVFRAPDRPELVYDLAVRILHPSLRNAIGVKAHLNAHVAGRCVRLEVDVGDLERLGPGGRSRASGSRKRQAGCDCMTNHQVTSCHDTAPYLVRVYRIDVLRSEILRLMSRADSVSGAGIATTGAPPPHCRAMNRRSGSMHPIDEALGMSRAITRRDFIHDVGIAALGLALPLPGLAAPQAAARITTRRR